MKVDINRIIDDRKYCDNIFRHYLKQGVLRKSINLNYEKNINKALSNLEFGNFILEEHSYSIKNKLPGKTFYEWCIVIYYYSIYHIILALIENAGYTSKSHAATLTSVALFYYHRTNLLNREDIEFIIDKININKEDLDLVVKAKSMRERACYGTDKIFELSMAKRLQEQTADFVNKIRLLLK